MKLARTFVTVSSLAFASLAFAQQGTPSKPPEPSRQGGQTAPASPGSPNDSMHQSDQRTMQDRRATHDNKHDRKPGSRDRAARSGSKDTTPSGSGSSMGSAPSNNGSSSSPAAQAPKGTATQ